MTRVIAILAALLFAGDLGLTGPGSVPRAWARSEKVDFVRDVEPIFRASCLKCHDQRKGKGQLRLDSRARAMHGGVSGPVIVPGDSRRSRLVQLLRAADPEERMPPPSARLSPAEIALVARWIDEGAVWPDSAAGDNAPVRPHWAYVKPVRPPPPAVRAAGWVRNPVDAFVLARLTREGLAPSPEAPRETLIRRVSLDLTGLPPSLRQIDAFVGDRLPDAYERLVDRLLASPHYGERWARPWLDLARYADTDGFNLDRPRSMWPYRDWVIRALNADMPFDRFTIEQIAGDLLPGATREQQIASGFHRNTMTNEEEGVDPEEARWETLVDRVNTTATVWLGTTLACAQCHNHKYDPFTQREYYRLLAFFEPADEVDLTLAPARHAERIPAVTTLVMRERAGGDPPSTHLRVRGSFVTKGPRVTAGMPRVLHPMREGLPPNRLGLAQWLVDADNPLIARVTVNRFWGEIFGRPLVATPEDFGAQGGPPTHPELLDWLATEFVAGGWRMKAVHRWIVTSATYRQASHVTPERLARDPDNRLLARGPRFRMEAEMLRDVALAVSGQLSRQIGGPSVFPPVPPGAGLATNNKGATAWSPSEGAERYRRGLYTHWRRTAPYPAFATFDAPSREVCTVSRGRTNTPLQALTTLNDPAFVDAARALARRLWIEARPDAPARAAYGFRLSVGRHPDAWELEELVAAYRRELQHYRTHPEAARTVFRRFDARFPDAILPELAAWTVVANILLNLDETLTKG